MAVQGIDHLVFIVRDIEQGIQQWKDIGLELTHRVSVDAVKMHQAFFKFSDGTFIELIAPASEASPLQKTLESNGEGFIALALKVEDFKNSIEIMEKNQVMLTGVGTDQTFVRPKSTSGVRIQLWDSERPHRWQSNPSESESD